VSICEPGTPEAIEVAAPEVPAFVPLIANPAWSPPAAPTHSFCNVNVEDVRVLVNVHVTAAGAAGTVNDPAKAPAV
jgi:hypothetical protein